MLLAVLQFILDEQGLYELVSELVAALPSGSSVISHPTDDFNPNKGESMKVYNERSAEQAVVRDQAATARFFEGLDLVEPGVVPVARWRPESDLVAARPSSMWCGVARKPLGARPRRSPLRSPKRRRHCGRNGARRPGWRQRRRPLRGWPRKPQRWKGRAHFGKQASLHDQAEYAFPISALRAGSYSIAVAAEMCAALEIAEAAPSSDRPTRIQKMIFRVNFMAASACESRCY